MLGFIQTIFCPNDDMYEKNIKSIDSLLKYYNKMGYSYKIILGGYCAKDTYYQHIVKMCSDFDVIIDRYIDNYGKAFIINDLISKYLVDTEDDYFITFDSDIIFKFDETDIVERIYDCYNYIDFWLSIRNNIEIDKKIGLIAFEQEVNCLHLDEGRQKKYTFENTKGTIEMLCRPHRDTGIAGGCIAIKLAVWNEVGGYRLNSVYGGDDAFLIQDLYKLGYMSYISMSIPIIHPFDNNELYTNWKNIMNNNISDDYYISIEETNNFWKSNLS
jgi:hypothetical protein